MHMFFQYVRVVRRSLRNSVFYDLNHQCQVLIQLTVFLQICRLGLKLVGSIHISRSNGSPYLRVMSSMSNERMQVIWSISLKMVTMYLEWDAECFLASDCHITGHNSVLLCLETFLKDLYGSFSRSVGLCQLVSTSRPGHYLWSSFNPDTGFGHPFMYMHLASYSDFWLTKS